MSEVNDAVVKYLNGLRWDGTERIKDALGEGEYRALASMIFFRDAVRRAFKPGCQANVPTLVLVGMGVGKTRFLQGLGKSWFAEIDPRSSVTGVNRALFGAWLVERALARRWSHDDLEDFKAWLSVTEDFVRHPYQQECERQPRACVVVLTAQTKPQGVVNEQRYLVVEVDRIPDPAPVRDQLWAEAVARYKAEACPVEGCTYATATAEATDSTPRERVWATTRSSESEDGYRDFDGWDVEEELARLRLAMRDGSPEALAFARVSFANLDEWLVRSGGHGLPRGWRHELAAPGGRWKTGS